MKSSISYSQVEQYCNELHNLANLMKENLQEIEETNNKILSSNIWLGKGAQYYQQKLNDITSQFDEIFIELENAVLFMAKCSSGYQEIDNKVMSEICNNLNITSPNLNTSNLFN